MALALSTAHGVAREIIRTPSDAEQRLLLQMAALIGFSLALGGAVSWVRSGAVSPSALSASLLYSPAFATLPALIAARFLSRARASGRTAGPCSAARHFW